MLRRWSQNSITATDAFSHYYTHFTRDENHFEANLHRLTTPVMVMWGEKDVYSNKERGVEFAKKAHVALTVLSGLGHYPHLQSPQRTIDEIRASFDTR
jgi:pimeloyl-ACP methyl ester carboxylesterase